MRTPAELKAALAARAVAGPPAAAEPTPAELGAALRELAARGPAERPAPTVRVKRRRKVAP